MSHFLHTVLESKVVNIKDQAAGNIDGALREWWQHGRELYEKRREQMKEVAHRCGITGSCKMLGESYEDRLKHFEVRYYGLAEDEMDETADVDEYVTSVGGDWEIE
jgi:hypothetical protein